MPDVLVDADTMIYKTAHKFQTGAINWGDDIVSAPSTDLEGAKADLDREIADLKATLFADTIRFATTGPLNFRKKVYIPYKANRSGVEKPQLLHPLRQYLHATRDCLEWNNIEADDVLGILGTSKAEPELILVSVDKDLLQIPGLHYNPMHPEFGVYSVSELEGFRWFMKQTLMGDPTDGYPGLPGVGSKKAEVILGDPGEATPKMMWEYVLTAFIERGYDKQYALSQARCARILQSSDYPNKKVKLWTPPK